MFVGDNPAHQLIQRAVDKEDAFAVDDDANQTASSCGVFFTDCMRCLNGCREFVREE